MFRISLKKGDAFMSGIVVKYDVLKTLSKATEKVLIYYMLLIGPDKVIY